MLQKEIKDWAFEVDLLTGVPSQFLIPANWIIENDLPKGGKNKRLGLILKSAKWLLIFEVLKVSKMTSLKIYLSPAMEKLQSVS